MFEEINFKSNDEKNFVRAVKWLPEEEPKYILQIAHGMAEHIMRYEDFAKFLNSQGFLVCGEDHLGHGKTAPNKAGLGYFADKEGHQTVVKDMKKLQDIIKQDYPKLPYFLLGHSMGSFLCREYIQTFGETLDGAIVMGTGNQPQIVLGFAKLLCRIISIFKGWRYRSKAINNLAVGGYNRRFQPIETGYEWLCRDNKQADRYQNDPYCGYIFTLNGFYNMFDMMSFIEKKSNINKIPKHLPVFICAGEEDPVGDFGTGPKIVHRAFKKAGIKDLKIKLYPKDRHEILNELDQDVVYDDILNWLKAHA